MPRGIARVREDGERLLMHRQRLRRAPRIQQPVRQPVQATRLHRCIAEIACAVGGPAEELTRAIVVAPGPECADIDQRLPLRLPVISGASDLEGGFVVRAGALELAQCPVRYPAQAIQIGGRRLRQLPRCAQCPREMLGGGARRVERQCPLADAAGIVSACSHAPASYA